MTRIKTHLPIIAMSPKESTRNLMALYKGVRPIDLPHGSERQTQLKDVAEFTKEAMGLNSGDHIAVTFGDVVGVDGHTNTLKIVQV